ncbi:MAG: aminotransferase class I/II-fold pyridoxal phosphate-dependent enzyme [Sulfuricellaceae bacterium]
MVFNAPTHPTLLQQAKTQLPATPSFIYFEEIVAQTCRHFQDLIQNVPRRQFLYSLKAATFPFLMRIMKANGVFGFDASSATEALFASRVLKPGENRLYVTAPAFSAADVPFLKQAAPTCVHLDSLTSLETVLRLAPELPIGLRLNHGIGFSKQRLHEAGGHRSRLGLPMAHLERALAVMRDAGKKQLGLHFHVTCEAHDFNNQAMMVHYLATQLPELLAKHELQLTHLDMGGGLRPPAWDFNNDSLVIRMDESSIHALENATQTFLDKVADYLADDFKFIFEPGDYLSCSSAVMVARILETRFGLDGREHLILDTNINHFPNVLHYNNTPEAILETSGTTKRTVTLSGNSCLGGDEIAVIEIPETLESELVVFTERGSYECTQLNFFNGRYRPNVYLFNSARELCPIQTDSVLELQHYWREKPKPFPEDWQSFHFFEKIVKSSKGLHLYHPQLNFISAFELDPQSFPFPQGIQTTISEQLFQPAMTYGRSLGHTPVRERIAAFENRKMPSNDFYQVEDVAFTLGATNAIWLCLRALFSNTSRSLLIHCPTYYQFSYSAYKHNIRYEQIHKSFTGELPLGAIEPDLLVPDIEDTLNAIRRNPDLGALFISNPGLPYGRYIDSGLLKSLADTARNEGWILILDETLADMLFPETAPPTYHWLEPDHPVIRLRSVSKTFGLPGARLGYLAISPGARLSLDRQSIVIDQMADLADSAFSAPPAALGPILCTGLDILEKNFDGAHTHNDVAQYRQNLAKLSRHAQIAGKILSSAGIPYIAPQGGASLMMALPKLTDPRKDSEAFFRGLFNTHSIFLELGGLFSQNPNWPFTIARLGLGRNEAVFAQDIGNFAEFYQSQNSAAFAELR